MRFFLLFLGICPHQRCLLELLGCQMLTLCSQAVKLRVDLTEELKLPQQARKMAKTRINKDPHRKDLELSFKKPHDHLKKKQIESK